MKYVDEFRRSDWARTLAKAIDAAVEPHRTYRLMEFCGGHTHAIARYGLASLLPPGIELLHGPGCPVCVLPMGRIDAAVELLARHPALTLCTYGDVLRAPGSGGMTLSRARALGARVRMCYSIAQALELARSDKAGEVVFFAIGFETTTAPTALALVAARREGLDNFSIYCNHVLTPAAMAHLLGEGQAQIDGFIGPSHVSAVIGAAPYRPIAQKWGKPIVIAGFEPLDVLQSILMLVRQINAQTALVQNQFTRVVSEEGNRVAQALIGESLQVRPSFQWRGLGSVPQSALAVAADFAPWDAERRYDLQDKSVADIKACACGEILRGLKKPIDCPVFGKQCTPSNPLGACMVSSEGACAAYYQYARFLPRNTDTDLATHPQAFSVCSDASGPPGGGSRCSRAPGVNVGGGQT